jgi:hypothetical protein
MVPLASCQWEVGTRMIRDYRYERSSDSGAESWGHLGEASSSGTSALAGCQWHPTMLARDCEPCHYLPLNYRSGSNCPVRNAARTVFRERKKRNGR